MTTKTCQYCNKSFFKKDTCSKKRWVTIKFCSSKCYWTAKKGTQNKERTDFKNCPHCKRLLSRRLFFGNSARYDGLSVLCRSCHTKITKPQTEAIKLATYAYLGGKCIRCGFSDPRALCLDHINGGGCKDRKINSLNKLRNQVLKGERTDIQLLCFNCNIIKKVENKEFGKKSEFSDFINS